MYVVTEAASIKDFVFEPRLPNAEVMTQQERNNDSYDANSHEYKNSVFR